MVGNAADSFNQLSFCSDVEKIRDGISEKVGHFLYLIIGFVITVAISFAYGWKLTLAVSVYIPIVIVMNCFVAKVQLQNRRLVLIYNISYDPLISVPK